MIDESTLTTSMQRHDRTRTDRLHPLTWVTLALTALTWLFLWLEWEDRDALHHSVRDMRKACEATYHLVRALDDSNERLWYRLDQLEADK